MLFILFIIVLIIILPIVLSLYLFLDFTNKKLYFGIYLFGFIKILSGYVNVRDKGGFYLHISNNKAIIIDNSTLQKIGGGTSFINAFQFSEIVLITDVSLNNIKLIFSILFVNKIGQIINKIIYSNNKLPKIRSNVLILSDLEKVFNLKCKAVLSFNILCIVKSLIANSISKGVSYAK